MALKPRDIDHALGTKIAFDLPYDPFLYLKAVNEGVPVVLGAAATVLWRAVRIEAERRAWLWLGAGMLFWALGHWQAEQFLATVREEDFEISPDAVIRPPSGNKRPMTRDDLHALLKRVYRYGDGSYRIAASKMLIRSPEGRCSVTFPSASGVS